MVVEVPGVVLLDFLEQLGLLGDQGVHVGVGFGEFLVDRVVAGQQVHDRLDAFAHDLEDGFVGIELRLLLEEADGVALAHGDLADVVRVHAGDDPEQGGFARAVQAEHADLGPVVEAERDVLQDLAVRRVDAPDALIE